MQIQASLKAHNESFDQLLRYIPAKFYIPDEEEPIQSVRFRSSFFFLQLSIPSSPDWPYLIHATRIQAPLTKNQKKAAKKNSEKVDVKAAKSEALRKAKLARVSRIYTLYLLQLTTKLNSNQYISTILMNPKRFKRFKLLN